MKKILIPFFLIFLLPFSFAASNVSVNVSLNGNITIYDNYFIPSIIYINKGSTVTWFNSGINNHTVTSQNFSGGLPLFDSGNVTPNSTFSLVFPNTGQYPYNDSNYAGMNGIVFVQSPYCGFQRNVCVGVPPQYCDATGELINNCTACGCPNPKYACDSVTGSCYVPAENCFNTCMAESYGRKFGDLHCGLKCGVPLITLWFILLAIVMLAVGFLIWYYRDGGELR